RLPTPKQPTHPSGGHGYQCCVRSSKWCLALAMLDKLAGIGLRPAILVAETRYDANADFRHDLEACGLGYVLQVKAR
ncbi:hypothetical protein ACJ6WD_38390, partial [Streptomyces sp. VTCC 41912]